MPRRAKEKAEAATTSASARVLGANVAALMAAHPELGSNPKLAAKTKLSSSTIHRLRNGEVDATLSTLERLADAFHMHVWQLLVPQMDPKNHPVLQFASPQEQRLYQRFREVAKEMKEEG